MDDIMYRDFLIAVDLDQLDGSKKAVRTALTLGAQEPDAVYRVMTVIPPISGGGLGLVSSMLPKNYVKAVAQRAEEALCRFTQECLPAEKKRQHIVALGTIYEEINHIAHKYPVDLVIMLAAKPGVNGLGPNAARVARYSDKPVLILR